MTKRYILSFLMLLSIYTIKSQFAASNFTLLSNTSPEPGSGIKYSGCWGWTQPVTNKEYAIVGAKNGTYFIDVTNPLTPTVSAYVPGTSTNGNWREVKTYQNYCYVMSDVNANGFQVIDMSTLPATVTLVSSNSNLFKMGHAGWVDGDKLYVSGVTYSTSTLSSMNVYSLANPAAPVLLRELKQDYSFVSYVHDAFVRHDTVFASCGPQGLQVFKFNANNTFTQLGSLTTYSGSGYNHATSLTPDGQTLVMLDEVPASLPIKILNVNNLANIQVLAVTNQFPQTTPHNPFVVSNQYCFISSYQDGTQLYDISNPSAPFLAGYFDTYNQGGGNNNIWSGSAYDGQWGCYPYFPSKNVLALDRQNGVFMIKSHLYQNVPTGIKSTSTTDLNLMVYPNPAQNELVFNLPAELINVAAAVEIYDAQGKLVLSASNNELQSTSIYQRSIKLNNLSNGLYILKLRANDTIYSSKKFTVSK